MIYVDEYFILISGPCNIMAKCFPAIWVDVKEGSEAAKESKKYKPIAEVQLKKVTKLCANSMSKVSVGPLRSGIVSKMVQNRSGLGH